MSDDTISGKLNNLESMVRLVLEQMQGVQERLNHVPTREELLAVQQTAVAVEDKAESGHILLESSLQNIINTTHATNMQLQQTVEKLNKLDDLVTEGFSTIADSQQKLYIALKAVSDKNEIIDEDVRDLKRRFG